MGYFSFKCALIMLIGSVGRGRHHSMFTQVVKDWTKTVKIA